MCPLVEGNVSPGGGYCVPWWRVMCPQVEGIVSPGGG